MYSLFLGWNFLELHKAVPFVSLSLPPVSHNSVVIKETYYNKRASDRGSAPKIDCSNSQGEQAANNQVGGLGDMPYYSKCDMREEEPKHRSSAAGRCSSATNQ